ATRERLTATLDGKPEQELYQFTKDLSGLEQQIAGLDFIVIAPRIGAAVKAGRLAIPSFGKEFVIDQQGRMRSECHVMPWVQYPLLAYAASSQHQLPTGAWIGFRDLPGGLDLHNLFCKRCELALKKLADAHPGLLHDLAELFQGEEAAGFAADTALILRPLPHFPILICWQAPEDGLESSLNILFDACCKVNLPIKAAFSLCIGLAQMFEKIALLHR
ncbi:DUF3786 domain-containing protein, partial [Desulfobulbus sp. F4]|nr:DUF3786 domain-containing protein [Desulfobulbus sp. F4]